MDMSWLQGLDIGIHKLLLKHNCADIAGRHRTCRYKAGTITERQLRGMVSIEEYVLGHTSYSCPPSVCGRPRNAPHPTVN